jgi:hypothetical protein
MALVDERATQLITNQSLADERAARQAADQSLQASQEANATLNRNLPRLPSLPPGRSYLPNLQP